MAQKKHEDIMIVAGDINACTGTNQTYIDGVCGAHGNLYINEAGREFRQLAANHQLVDLLT
jgi:hypothetical protein